MAAGAGYIEFATGDILTASAANSYLASQVVMVFASASARTSAIASPQEGMISYLKDTNSTEYYSGTAWTPIASSSSSALTLIGTTTLTSSGPFNLASIFSSTYDNYLIIGSEMVGSTASYLTFGLRSGSTNATTTYSGGQVGYAYSGSSVGSGSSGGSAIGAFDFSSGDTNAGGFHLKVNSPFLAKATTFHFDAAQYNYTQTRQGIHGVASSYDSMWFTINSGTLSGKVSVYGYAK